MATDTPTPREAIPEERGVVTLPERVGVSLLVLGLCVSLVWLVHPWYDPTNDGAMYILTGRSLVRGEGYSMLGMAFTIRPPGFSALIAPILALRGTDFQALNLFVSLFGVLGCCLLYCFVRARLGWVLAVLVALVVWCNPGYQLLCNQAMSDVPGTALLAACLLLERRVAARPSLRGNVLLGAAIGLSAYVRTVNILLVPTIWAVRCLGRSTRRKGEPAVHGSWRAGIARAALLGLAALLVQLPWSVRNSNVASPPPADQTRLYSYWTGMFNADMGDPSSPTLSSDEILARFPHRGGQALGILGQRLTEDHAGELGVACFLLLSVAVVFVKRREASELFLLGTLGIISIYFGFAPRLLLPIYLFALPAAAEVVRDLARLSIGNLVPRRWAPLRTHSGNLIAAFGLAFLLVHDFDPRKDWTRIERAHASLGTITERFEERLEPDAVVASQRAWHYAVRMDRPVYALEFAWRRRAEPAALEDLIDKYGINTVILSPHSNWDRTVLPYFDRRYGPQANPVSRIYRVR